MIKHHKNTNLCFMHNHKSSKSSPDSGLSNLKSCSTPRNMKLTSAESAKFQNKTGKPQILNLEMATQTQTQESAYLFHNEVPVQFSAV